MHLGKAIKFINLSIAVLLGVFVVAAYWLCYRTLPQTSGTLAAPISAHASVVRDERGTPHITAANWEDAVFLQGFVTAQDRMWQMDALRRLAAGELAEVVGPPGLVADREARQLRMRHIAEEDWRALPPADRAVMAAYARGVNYYIETHRGNYPLEFRLLGYDPRPWSPVDSMLAGLQMNRSLTTSWHEELEKQLLLAAGNAAKVNQLFPVRSGREVQPGSNAWVISGKRTASGKPLLANDPHLEYGIPSTWYMVHLKAPGLNVTGVSLPGVPCIIIGHNDRIAWGVTNLGFDVQDLYEERLDPQSGRYLFQGQMEQARLEQEPIGVKGQKPVQFAQWVTRHGPVIVAERNRFIALRWAAAESASFQFPFLDLNRAGNWTDFRKAVARFPGPGQNFVYADVDGNIGYQASGLLPVRKTYDGDVPVDGSSGENEWQGFIPFEELPSVFNPAQGFVVTANQNPFPANYPYRVSGMFGPPYRSGQIRDLLVSRNGWKAPEFLNVQKDVYSGFLLSLAKQTVAAYDAKRPSQPELNDTVTLLRNWNGQVEKGTAAPMIASLLYLELRKGIGDAASPGHGQAYTSQMAPWAVENILASGQNVWFTDRNDFLLRALTRAFEEGRKQQGGDVKRWDYGQYNELTIRQPVDSQIPLLGTYFNIGPVPMSGASTTIKQTTLRVGPSMRFIADLSNWDASLNNLLGGESGQILSGHYKDQWDAYYAGYSFPMEYGKVDERKTLQVEPQP